MTSPSTYSPLNPKPLFLRDDWVGHQNTREAPWAAGLIVGRRSGFGGHIDRVDSGEDCRLGKLRVGCARTDAQNRALECLRQPVAPRVHSPTIAHEGPPECATVVHSSSVRLNRVLFI